MKETLNIYYYARVEASKREPLLSNRDRAAERLYVSADSLRNYEHGTPLPPCDVVQRMIEVYDAPSLKSAHICAYCPIITDYQEDKSQLAEAALGWALSIQGTNEYALTFASIARDGKITRDELAIANDVRAKAVDVRNTMEATVVAIDKALYGLKGVQI